MAQIRDDQRVPYDETLNAFRRGDNDAAERLARADLADAQRSSDVSGEVDALCMLARVALRRGALDQVQRLAHEAAEIARTSGDERLERMPIHLLAVEARMSGRLAEARELYLTSIELNERLGEARMAAAEHRNLAYVELHDGKLERARALVREARARRQALDYPALDAYLAVDAATLAAADGDFRAAERHLRVAVQMFDDLAVIPDPDDETEIERLRSLLADHR